MKAEREHEYYQVFARRKEEEPMQHIGTVGASEPDDAEVFAFKLYDQWRWASWRCSSRPAARSCR